MRSGIASGAKRVTGCPVVYLAEAGLQATSVIIVVEDRPIPACVYVSSSEDPHGLEYEVIVRNKYDRRLSGFASVDVYGIFFGRPPDVS